MKKTIFNIRKINNDECLRNKERERERIKKDTSLDNVIVGPRGNGNGPTVK